MRFIRLCMLVIALVALPTILTACPPAVIAALPVIVAAVQDAALIIDSIEQFVQRYFAAHPDAAKEKTVAKAIAKCRAALNATLRAANGIDELNQQKFDEAFADFKVSYTELLAVTSPLGVKPAGSSLLLAPSGETLEVPTPEAFTKKVTAP